jgi:hypothetical protein
MRLRDRLVTEAPRFRDPRTGEWIPALVVPAELGEAIARELHQIFLRAPAGSCDKELLRALE